MRERRKYVRVISNLALRYKIEEEFVTGAGSYDIGGGGIRIITGEGIPAGSVLSVEIDLPDHARTIPARARVVWAQDMGNGFWEVAMEFTEIEARDRDKVLKHAYFSYKKTDEV
ncbi:MAG: PilZ domain-containing protein [bacterium]